MIRILGILGIVFLLLAPVATATDDVCTNTDVVIVLDNSGSMAITDAGETESRMELAKDAAKEFVDLLTDDDRSGLVSFATTASLVEGLTFDKSDVKDAIDSVGATSLTCIACGIDVGQAELMSEGRDNVSHVIVLLSDGVPNRPSGDPEGAALAAAADAKADGTLIFTIGIGAADEDLLMDIASEDDFYSEGDSGDLSAIYSEIADAICDLPDPVDDTPTDEVPEFGIIGASLVLIAAGLFVARRRSEE